MAKPRNEMDDVADYCVVGAGPAGCVVASRLTESGAHKVVLLEAGPRDWHPYIHIPATCLFLQSDKRFNWLYQSEPEFGTTDRVFKLSQGRVLGGSSSINGMLHVRGQAEDFNQWAQAGCRGWSYEDVIPYFRKAETYNGRDETGLRGRSGPHAVSDFLNVHPLTQAFVEAAQETGLPLNPDMNGASREGVAFYQQNRKGRFRGQPAQTYLRQARGRANLDVRTEAVCTRILFEGHKAVGVEYVQGGVVRTIRARREVILSAGAIKTPHLLQLSGIGDPEHLGGLGVEPLVARPSVGRNLRDHFQLRVGHRVKDMVTLNERTRGLSIVKETLKYAFLGTGVLTMGAGTAAIFFRSREGLAAPDAQLIFAPGSFAAPGVLEKEPGMTIGAWPSRPESQGTVLARTANALEQPAIAPNYLTAQEDRRVVIECVRKIREIFASPAMSRWSVRETFPGPDVNGPDEVLEFAKNRGTSGLHFVGTCRMGSDDAAVVDPELRVRGVKGLRVVDASVMPNCTVGNTNASVVMIGEKASDLILSAAA
ncbi:GMC family oxidoreductase N-terminal domain-containing protein [Corticibacterium sp. UT-5YL-CI-8]|nr:GMC family oxidoreductase N-terminal domain-containing protein [Tianweitania sp. UT-5YL-CI-8]